MRWLSVYGLMLACIATTLASEETRSKRDLQFWKDLIAAKLGLISPPKPVIKQDVKVFRIPGFEQVLVRAVPKDMVPMPEPVPERVIPVDPTLLAIQSYLGTRTPDQTIMALQGVKNLLHSGVLEAKRDLIELPPPSPPVYMMPPFVKKEDCPEPRPLQVIQKTVMSMPQPTYPFPAPEYPVPFPKPIPAPEYTVPFSRPIPAPEYPVPFPRPITAPEYPVPYPRPIPVLPPPPIFPEVPVATKVILPQIRPLPPMVSSTPPLVPFPPRILPFSPRLVPLPPPSPLVPISVIPNKYSYKQMNVDGSMTSFLSLGSQELVITETRKPLPPPPSYIVDRFQKIIFGMPLGVKMTPVPAALPFPVVAAPRPVVDVVVSPPIYPKPILPIFKEAGNVEVTVTHPNKKLYEGMINIYEGTLIKNPKTGAIEKDSSKTGSSGTSVEFDHISELPLHSPQILKRFEKILGKKPHGIYSMKMSNGMGTYETIDGGKIYYSHLLPGQTAYPAPLSSQSDKENENSNGNVFAVGDDTKTDESDRAFLSSKIKEEGSPTTSDNQENQREKKYPPLPMPIAGENEKSVIPNPDNVVSPSIDFTKDNDESSDGFSYTQINHDGTVTKISGDGNVAGPEIVAEALKPVIIEERPPLPPAPVIEFKVERPGFSYTQINNAGVSKVLGGPKVFPVRPAVILKPMVSAPSVIAVEDCLKGFSYTQLKGGEVTVIKEDRRKPVFVRKFGVAPVVRPAPAIVDVIRPAPPPVLVGYSARRPQIIHKMHRVPGVSLPPAVIDVKPASVPIIVKKPTIVHKVERVPILPPPPELVEVVKPVGPVAVKVGKQNGPVMFAEPVVSRYTFKQISHTKPQPFTIVPVGNQPMIGVPKGEVRVKVNRHQHRRPDGTVYPCTEVHMVPTADPVVPIDIPVAPLPPLPIAGVVSTVPRDVLFVPPSSVHISGPSSKKVNFTKTESRFSYKQVSSATTTVPSTSTETTTSAASESTPLSFNLNPIVVAPEKTNYSYTQTHSDGSSVNIKGDNGQVHVNVNDSNDKRGDIPDAMQ